MCTVWSASSHQFNLISTPDGLIDHKHNQFNKWKGRKTLWLFLNHQINSLHEAQKKGWKRRRYLNGCKWRDFPHHVELFPHGAPVSQRRRHLGDDGVFHWDDCLKLPTKSHLFTWISLFKPKSNYLNVKTKKLLQRRSPFVLHNRILQVDVAGWEDPLWTEDEQVKGYCGKSFSL